MRNSKFVTALWALSLFALPSAFAYENDSDDWVLSGTAKSRDELQRAPVDPIELARIKDTGNDNPPSYAADIDAALLSAAAQDDLLGVQTLLKNGADPNARDALGNRPLLHAARLGSTETVHVLLEAGADPNVKGVGYTALGFAALHGYPKVAAWLLKFGAFVYKRSDNGLTPLMNAALVNSIPVLQEILHYDTDIDRENPAGRTALSYAAEGGAEQAIELLLSLGADVNAVDRKFNTPIFWAAVRDQRSAVRLLLRHGAEPGAVSLDLL